MFNKLIRSVLTLILCLVTQGTIASPILNIDAGGKLIGASNVSVSGLLYDVTFVDGTCAAFFDGCDDPADFTFRTETDARAAFQALFDQVFIDSALGAFDSLPGLTAPCLIPLSNSTCYLTIPYDLPSQTEVSVLYAQNQSHVVDIDPYLGTLSPSFDLSRYRGWIFAKWTPSSSASVPEPNSILLIGMGILGLFGLHGRGKKGLSKAGV